MFTRIAMGTEVMRRHFDSRLQSETGIILIVPESGSTVRVQYMSVM